MLLWITAILLHRWLVFYSDRHSGNEFLNREVVEEFDQARIATASNLLGHSVLVPGNIARPDKSGEVHGVLDLPKSTISTSITYRDADTNNELHFQDLGPQSSGLVGFKWSEIPEDILNGTERIKKSEAMIDAGDGPEQL